jgi:hypothetical protein
MSALPSRRYHVVVLEWVSHKAMLEACSKEEAEAIGLDLWNEADTA